jgi:hypothetical protein
MVEAWHIVTTPSGEELLVHLPTFYREHDLSYDAMTACVGKSSRKHKVYTVRRISDSHSAGVRAATPAE